MVAPSATAIPLPLSDFGAVALRIEAGDHVAAEELYHAMQQSFRCIIRRHTKSDEVEDVLHDAFLIVISAVRGGGLRDGTALMAFARTVTYRRAVRALGRTIRERRTMVCLGNSAEPNDAEEATYTGALRQQRFRAIDQALWGLSHRERDILTRFYLEEQCPRVIRGEMGLTERQYRMLKFTARERLILLLPDARPLFPALRANAEAANVRNATECSGAPEP